MQKDVYEFISKKTNDPIIERRVCCVSGEEFAIFQSDKELLEHISPVINGKKQIIPLPTLCPEMRQMRRLCFRNERTLYSRTCDKTGKRFISVFSKDSPFTVYSQEVYRSDDRDPYAYGQEYKPGISLFDQLKDLSQKVPCQGIDQSNLENSEYTHHMGNAKNCYMVFSSNYGEDLMYCERSTNLSSCVDVSYSSKSQRLYNSFDIYGSSIVIQSEQIIDSSHIFFSQNTKGSHHVILSDGVFDKNYVIRNQVVSKEEYMLFYKKFRQQISTYSGYQEALKEQKQMKRGAIRKAVDMVNVENSIGNNLVNTSDVQFSYAANDIETGKYLSFARHSKNVIDGWAVYKHTEKAYEVIASGDDSFEVYFSHMPWQGSMTLYSMGSWPSNHHFASVFARNTAYTILNMKYTPEEWERNVDQIIQHMSATKEWGEFFDSRLSWFPYNDTLANDFYPIRTIIHSNGTKEEINPTGLGIITLDDSSLPITNATIDFGGKELVHTTWRTIEHKVNVPDTLQILQHEDIPDDIIDVSDDIFQKAVICKKSGRPYRIVKAELSFYKHMGLPIPRLHPEERYQERMKNRPDMHLYARRCDKTGEEILSVYPEGVPFNVYSEEAYQKEVYG